MKDVSVEDTSIRSGSEATRALPTYRSSKLIGRYDAESRSNKALPSDMGTEAEPVMPSTQYVEDMRRYQKLGKFLPEDGAALHYEPVEPEVINAWLTDEANDSFEDCTVSKSAEKRGRFVISLKDIESEMYTEVIREASEFRRLEAILRNRFPGALILPCGNTQESLTFFLDSISQNPVLRRDVAFKEFIRERGRKFSSEIESTFPAATECTKYWYHMVHSISIDEGIFSVLTEAKTSIYRLSSLYEKLYKNGKKSQAARKQGRQREIFFATLFREWYRIEVDQPKLLFGSTGTEPTEMSLEVNLPDTLGGALHFSELLGSSIYNSSKDFIDDYLNTISFELAHINEMVQMIEKIASLSRKHAQMIAAILSANDRIERLRQKEIAENSAKKNMAGGANQKAPSASKSQQAALTKLKAKITSLEAETLTRQLTMKFLIRAIFFEFRRFNYDRTQRIDIFIYKFLAVHRKEFSQFLDHCREKLDTLTEIPSRGMLVAFSQSLKAIQNNSFDAERSVRSIRKPEKPAVESKSQFRACYDFEAEDKNELSLTAGDIVSLISFGEECDGWSTVEDIGGKRGLVPTSYLERVTQTESTKKPLKSENSVKRNGDSDGSDWSQSDEEKRN